MKLRRLKIHNIASIEDATIDFDSAPLEGCGVFLITGKTGAGKSTILDSICLALYGTTPRLANTRMQGEAAETDGSVTLKDPRQLMRRNCGECFVCLSFRGSNEIEYESTWSAARAHRKPGRRLQPKTWTLQNLKTGTSLTKDREIEAEIIRATGLDFKQFCRTVMLAQGDFTRFLNSPDNEKAEILEKITGAEIYRHISARIFQTTSEKKAELDEMARRSGDAAIMSDEEVAMRHSALEEMRGKLETVEKRCAETEDAINRLNTFEAMRNALETALKEAARAKERTTSEETSRMAETVELWNLSAEARSLMSKLSAVTGNRKRQEERLEALGSEWLGLSVCRESLKRDSIAARMELERIELIRTKEAPREKAYENAELTATLLRNADAARKRIATAENNIKKQRLRLEQELIPRASSLNEQKNRIALAAEAAANGLDSLRNILENSGLKEKRREKEATERRLADARLAAERFEALRVYEAMRQEEDLRISHNAETLGELKIRIAGLEKAGAECARIKEEKESELARQRDTVDKFAREMRRRLHPGDRCPVCGQTIESALPSDSELTALCAIAEAAAEKARSAFEDITRERLRMEAEAATLSRSIAEIRQRRQTDDGGAHIRRRAEEAWNKCFPSAADGSATEAIERLVSALEKRAAHLSEEISEGEKTEKDIAKRAREAEELLNRTHKAEMQATAAKKDIDDCRQSIEFEQRIIEEKQNDARTCMERAAEYLAGVALDPNPENHPLEAAARLQELAGEYRLLVSGHESLKERESQRAEQLARIEESLEGIDCFYGLTENDNQAEPIDAADAVDAARRLRLAVNEAMTLIKVSRDEERACVDGIDRFISGNKRFNTGLLSELTLITPEKIREMNDCLRLTREQLVSSETLVEKARRDLASYCETWPEGAGAESVESLKTRLESLRNEQRDLLESQARTKAELEADEKTRLHRQDLLQKTAEAHAEWKKWEKLNRLFGERSGAKFRKIAQSYILASLIEKANVYMARLSDRYTLEVAAGSFVISLVDSYQGYTSRSAATISGGESFLVSLALALALSDMGIRVSSDTLFIDEGFGTLSGEPLQNAIETLRSLHRTSGRQVGIISHVRELRECLPVQIRVERDGNLSAGRIRIIPDL
ncbi:MAG: AAA family ATPase [Paramuribaculum sp.]|nr:AAA family ATPase [Paramuribaculum sp.]